MKKLKLEDLGRISVDEFKEVEKLPIAILLDNIRSLHNVGSIFRTADAFRVEKIFLTGITGTPPHREINKTALGATESVAWEYFESPILAVQKLKMENYGILVAEQTTKSLSLQQFRPKPKHKLCVVFGNEVHGVSEEVVNMADIAIEIPQIGTKHSLNVSVCAGIVIWEIFKQIRF